MNDHIDPGLIAKAKEWADKAVNRELPDSTRAAVDLVHALPDTIVGGDKLRGILTGISNGVYEVGAGRGVSGIAEDLRALLSAPTPLTLADMTPAERAKCQWMQAEHRDERCIIIRVPGYTSKPVVSLLTATGSTIWTSPDEVIPLPDLPRLVWPASEPEPAEESPEEPERTYAPGGGVVQEALDKLNPPEPQAGEAWLINDGEREIAAILDGNGDWWHVTEGVIDLTMKDNANIFIARLVPEVAPKVLTTEEDYENAPFGTICAEDGKLPIYTNTQVWGTLDGKKYDHRDLAGTPRRVLRWGMGEQA